jgi:hypothetical protein
MFVRPAALALALAACRPPDPADPDPTEPTVVTPTGPTLGTASVFVPVVAGQDAITTVSVADADGAFVRTVPITGNPVVIDDMPIGGSVTVARVLDIGGSVSVAMETVADVHDGDVLHPSVQTSGAVIGSTRVSVPSGPQGVGQWVEVRALCAATGGVTPLDLTLDMYDSCSAPGAAADVWVEAIGPVGAMAVAWQIGAPVRGTAQTVEATPGPWVVDFGLVQLDHWFPGGDVVSLVRLHVSRGPLITASQAYLAYDAPEGTRITLAAPTHPDFHDHAIFTLEQYEDASGTAVSWSSSEIADYEVLMTSVSPADLPPSISADGVDRQVDVTVGEAWACDGRAPNHGRLLLSGSGSSGSVEWSVSMPMSTSLRAPELAPELEALLAVIPLVDARATVVSLAGGYDAIRQSWRVDGSWPQLLAERPAGERICTSSQTSRL